MNPRIAAQPMDNLVVGPDTEVSPGTKIGPASSLLIVGEGERTAQRRLNALGGAFLEGATVRSIRDASPGARLGAVAHAARARRARGRVVALGAARQGRRPARGDPGGGAGRRSLGARARLRRRRRRVDRPHAWLLDH